MSVSSVSVVLKMSSFDNGFVEWVNFTGKTTTKKPLLIKKKKKMPKGRFDFLSPHPSNLNKALNEENHFSAV